MKQILAITRKELNGYFNSLLAVIFLGTYLAAIAIIFFTVEGFFARGIADIRPLFSWIPVLMIFLIAALTMRQWSEEQRSGTLEVLLSLPTSHVQLVLGKFLAVMSMIGIALLLTLPFPIMVSLLGNLDWGPVIGGYLASILIAAAYASIGLFISSRTDNQIVSLILTVITGGAFYLIGSSFFTSFFPTSLVEIFRAIGTGSRFESIQRGVIDIRDLVYYGSLSTFFIVLNVLSIDRLRWSQQATAYRFTTLRTTALICLNLIAINVWIYPLYGLRLDLTSQKEFTISQTTRDLTSTLPEQLLIRAYLSEKTHPLLSPLIPQISDMLKEYEIASRGMITAEVVDPIDNPEIETEANQAYGIQPTPFQIAGRNESSIVNAYFDILVRYGDQAIVIGLEDLIEVQQTATGVNVSLKNLEYNLTSAVKKTVYGFQSIDSILAEIEDPVKLTLLLSQNLLPENENEIVVLINQIALQIQDGSKGKFIFEIVDPDVEGASISRQQLIEELGIEPYPVALFSQDSYFFHLLLQNGDQAQIIYPPTEANEADIRLAIESALKRTSSGFLKVIGIWTPPTTTQDIYGQTQQAISSYRFALEQLNSDYELQYVDLSTGRIPDNFNAVVIIAPQNLGEIEQYAIDQFLMRGGAVILAISPYKLDADYFSGFLTLTPIETGLLEMLNSYGIFVQNQLVMDTQNAAFPVAVNRNVGQVQVQEIQAVDYPYFVDVRPEMMAAENLIVSGLPAISMNWASPVQVQKDVAGQRETTVLLSSSNNAWTSTSTNIQPDFELYPELGFEVGETRSSYPLAISTQGSFESFFKDKPVPVVTNPDGTENTNPGFTTINQSSTNSRLVVFGSAGFIDDFPLQLSSRLTQDYVVNNLRLLQNAVNWSVEDTDLLAIRSRGSATRVLIPLDNKQQTFWEISIYVIEAILLFGLYTFWQIRKRKNKSLSILTMQSKTSREGASNE
jgi:ABC-2 type transport system permease protein